jgi:hypothetical protein
MTSRDVGLPGRLSQSCASTNGNALPPMSAITPTIDGSVTWCVRSMFGRADAKVTSSPQAVNVMI